ncbi:MAG: GAF domain-containing protein [Thermoanaerobacteraceae bacterium]
MDKKVDFDKILDDIKEISKKEKDLDKFYNNVINILSRNIPYYNWTGFYFIKNGELVIGPYIGRPTEHVKIKIGEGICGRAVAEKNTIVVDDVSKENNYLACSLETRSEIVVPIWLKDKIIGEIDIDSDEIKAFDQKDKEFLEAVAEIISNKIIEEKH